MTERLETEVYQYLETDMDIQEQGEGICRVIEKNSKEHLVKDFMITTGQIVRSTPQFPETKEEMLLRLSLIQEELFELAQACGKEVFDEFRKKAYQKATKDINTNVEGNLVEVLDAFADLQYVLSGSIHSFGMGNIIDEAFEDVHDSNMFKVCTTFEEANRTVEKYQNEGVETIIQESGKYYIVLRKFDRKVLKSIDYKAVDLKKYIKNGY